MLLLLCFFLIFSWSALGKVHYQHLHMPDVCNDVLKPTRYSQRNTHIEQYLSFRHKVVTKSKQHAFICQHLFLDEPIKKEEEEGFEPNILRERASEAKELLASICDSRRALRKRQPTKNSLRSRSWMMHDSLKHVNVIPPPFSVLMQYIDKLRPRAHNALSFSAFSLRNVSEEIPSHPIYATLPPFKIDKYWETNQSEWLDEHPSSWSRIATRPHPYVVLVI